MADDPSYENKSGVKNYFPITPSNEPGASGWREFIRFTVIAIIIVVPFRLFVAQPFIVSGASMSPTFETGQYLIVDELTYHFESPKRGDVVILKKPFEESEYLIKRIVGLPGDTIIVKDGMVSIKAEGTENAFTIPEPYVKNVKMETFEKTVGKDEYFVMGDNRPVSLDSRYIGPIPKNHVVGRAILRLFPISKIDYFPGRNL